MVTQIRSVSACIDAFGGTTAFGRVIGKRASTASEMRRRGSIPIKYWQTLIESPRGQELGLTVGDFMQMHAEARS